MFDSDGSPVVLHFQQVQLLKVTTVRNGNWLFCAYATGKRSSVGLSAVLGWLFNINIWKRVWEPWSAKWNFNNNLELCRTWLKHSLPITYKTMQNQPLHIKYWNRKQIQIHPQQNQKTFYHWCIQDRRRGSRGAALRPKSEFKKTKIL